MFQNHRVGALLLMGGNGERFASATLKQFALLEGKPLYSYALQTLQESAFFDEILLVCHPNWIHKVEKGLRIVPGGKSRQASSFAGIASFSSAPEYILIHDAVRPFLTKKIIEENLRAAIQEGAADTCIPSADTLVFAPEGTKLHSIPNRDHFFRGQTPQTAKRDWLLQAHLLAERAGIREATDDCALLLHAGYPVSLVLGSEENFKITVPFDLAVAERILHNRREPYLLETL